MLQRPARQLVAHVPKLARPIASTSSTSAVRRRIRSAPLRRAPAAPRPQTSAPEALTTLEPEPSTSVTAEAPPVSRIPVEVPHDPLGILDNASEPWADRVKAIFSHPAIVVTRQLEALNLIIGYEQANKYEICAPSGERLAFLVEEENNIGHSLRRQFLKTHRPFTATVLDLDGQTVLLKIRRPFSWINSRIVVSAPSETGREADEVAIGEAQSEWHIYRRKYHQFVSREGEMAQFGTTDSGLLAWDFTIRDEEGKPIGSINRNFSGFGRELFTDTGAYVLRFEGVVDELNPQLPAPSTPPLPAPSGSDPATPTVTSSAAPPAKEPSATATPSQAEVSSVPAVVDLPSIPFDHRAVMLAQAVSIDFDFFTRSRGGMMPGMGGMFFPFPMGGGGGAAGEAGAEAGAGEAAGAAGEEALPPTQREEGGQSEYGQGEGGYGGYGQGEVGGYQDGGAPGWGDEVMQDPWANQGQAEEGGTWNWGDLFPGDE